MANISNHLNNIKNAVFGKEIRTSIHDGIDAINKEVEGTTKKQNTLSEQFKNLIINAGNSNAEVAASRGDFDYLPERLDAVDEQFISIEKKKSLRLDLVDFFGVDETGNIDASDIIQNAINSLDDEKGVTFTFPSNAIIKVAKTINILNKNNIKFEGNGSGYLNGCFKGVTPNMTIFNIQSHGITFSNVRIEGDTTMTGVVVGDCYDTTIDDFRFIDDSTCRGLGIGINIKTRNLTIRDSNFIECDKGIVIDEYKNDIDNSQDYHFYNNRFHNSINGIVSNGYIKDIIITGNKFDDIGNAILLENGCDNSIISNNIISQSSGCGISVRQTKGAKLNVIISSNIIYGNKTTDTKDGIFFEGEKSNIINNIIFSKSKNGINVSKANYCNILNNRVESCSYFEIGSFGINVVSGTNNIITGNICRNAGKYMNYGIALNDSVTFTVLRDNICDGLLDDINIGNSTVRGEICSITEMPRVMYSDTLITSGTFRAGDEIKKRNPVIISSGEVKYYVDGWKRITTGSNNQLGIDWVEMKIYV